MSSYSDSYKAAGVDVTAGYRAVELMKKHVARTCLLYTSRDQSYCFLLLGYYGINRFLHSLIENIGKDRFKAFEFQQLKGFGCFGNGQIQGTDGIFDLLWSGGLVSQEGIVVALFPVVLQIVQGVAEIDKMCIRDRAWETLPNS